MLNSRLIRIAAVSGVLLSIMLIGAFALDMAIVQTTGGQPLLNPDSAGSELLRAKGSTVWLLEGWVYTLMIVPAFVFILAPYQVLRRDDSSLAAIGLFAAALFWIFHTLHNAAMLAVLQILVPGYTAGTPQALSTELLATTLLGLANILFGFGTSVGAFFLIGFLFAFGFATLRSSRLPRWTGYVLLAAGIAISVSYLQFLSIAFTLIGVFGWVLSIIWVVATTITFLRPTSRSSVVAEPSTA